MAQIVRAGLIQQRWTGDKDSMIAAAVNHIQTAASAGAQVVCLQELFYGPYFCAEQETRWYDLTEKVPDGPTTKQFAALAKKLGIPVVHWDGVQSLDLPLAAHTRRPLGVRR